MQGATGLALAYKAIVTIARRLSANVDCCVATFFSLFLTLVGVILKSDSKLSHERTFPHISGGNLLIVSLLFNFQAFVRM